MTIPAEFLSEFQVNTGTAATGTQNQPQIIGLSNGNILVAWDELSEGVGGSAGSDLVGKIFDDQGNVVRDSFQINALRAIDNEGDFDIAATNDGGFVVTYVDNDISSPNHTTIIWERFDSDGFPVSGSVVADENVAADDLSNPQIALNLTDNSFVVTFTDLAGGNTDINAVSVEFTNAAGTTYDQSTEFSAAQNSSDIDDMGDVAILSDGNYVGVNREFDATAGIDITIFQPDGTLIRLVENFAPGTNTTPRVTGLANGNFVLVWNQTNSNNGDILGRIYDPAGNVVQTTFTIAGTASSENEPDVQALPDGGFVVAWDDESFGLRARAYLADATPDGAVFDFAEGSASDTDVGVSADGRILFAWQEQGEMQSSIWRGNPIDAADYRPEQTNFASYAGPVFGSNSADKITGTDLADELRGRLGADTITGGDGADVIGGGGGRDVEKGGNGADYLSGNDGNDKMYGGSGTDTLEGGSGADEMRGGSGNDTVYGNKGHDNIRGQSGSDYLSGDKANDTVRGDDGSDKVFGGSGNDRVYGGDGNDVVKGGNGNDVVVGGNGKDLMAGAGGSDTFVFNKVSQTANSLSQSDIILDFKHGTDRLNLRPIDASKFLAGNNAFEFEGMSGADNGDGDGEVWFEHLNRPGTANDLTVVYLDNDGDAAHEGMFRLKGLIDLTADDFLL
ncbi:hypothetical protein [Pseudoruegeria sp. HB172150]|uniref:hypothetical protein n=1 Tax=Pseudoruegeria sp. HB172150 TaxID=2721164 RepID=UPI0015573BB2|nr:hypothetical protein [Pseudoruegeria sp. HB172150]